MTNDVEKRWNDPGTFRAAARYAATVIALAALWMFGYLVIDPASLLWGFGGTLILVCGGIGAFVQAYRVYKRGGTWPLWQGAGWILFSLMLVSMIIVV